MEKIAFEQIPDLFEEVARMFAEKKEELCALDAAMGDGDLGLTMSKGYAALPDLLRSCAEPGDIGKTLAKAGMKMASVVPSTMGTLMASGIMEGGKALKGCSEITPIELAKYLSGFSAGVQNRGKCNLGDRTILDAISEGAVAAEAAAASGDALANVMQAAVDGAARGVEKTKQMLPKFGKAAVFSGKSIGVPDQGAVAGVYMLMGMLRYMKSM